VNILPLTKSIGKDEFHSRLRELGCLHNTASTVSYDEERDETSWLICGKVVGITEGVVGASRSYQWVIGEIDADFRTITEWE
jgi:hypothetical protein